MGLGANSTVGDTNIVSGPGGTDNGATMFIGATGSQVKIENIAMLDTTYSLSIFLNVYADETGSIVNYGNERSVGLYYDKASSEIVFRLVKRNTTQMFLELKTKLDAKKWYHVGGTYNYNTGLARLFVDGKQGDVSSTPRTDMLATDSAIYLGAIGTVTDNFKGRVSCLQIFDRPLQLNEIDDLKKCELSKLFYFLHP